MEIPQNARQPQDHRQQIEVEDLKPEFEFERNGRTYSIPPASTLKMGVARKWRHLPESEQIMNMLEALCDDDTMAALDDMTGAEFALWHRDFQNHQIALSRILLGESTA